MANYNNRKANAGLVEIILTDEMKERTFEIYPHLTEGTLKDIILNSEAGFRHPRIINGVERFFYPGNYVLKVPKGIADFYNVDDEMPLFLNKYGYAFSYREIEI